MVAIARENALAPSSTGFRCEPVSHAKMVVKVDELDMAEAWRPAVDE